MTATPLDRDQFPVSEHYHYLNHGGVAPLSLAAAEAGRAFVDDFVRRGAVGLADWEAAIESVRATAASLMGVASTEVAFVKNTTEGLAFVANGLPWQAGDRVLVANREFPSTIYPWLSLRELRVTVDLIEPVGDGWTLPLDRFEQHLAEAPTKVVAVSWVQFSRGWRTDIEALATLCHEHGALLCVDAIQGLGVVPASFNRWGVDFATADAHKWMLGPLGTGVLYVAERNLDRLRPLEPGWASVAHRESWDNLKLVYDPSARRFEGGSQTIDTILQMGASLDLILDAGVDRIWHHVDGLLDDAVDRLVALGAVILSDRSEHGRSGNVTFAIDGVDAVDLCARLEARHVICSPRGGGTRISPHGYTSPADIDALVDAVQACR